MKSLIMMTSAALSMIYSYTPSAYAQALSFEAKFGKTEVIENVIEQARQRKFPQSHAASPSTIIVSSRFRDRLNSYYKRSVEENIEYGAFIYQDPNTGQLNPKVSKKGKPFVILNTPLKAEVGASYISHIFDSTIFNISDLVTAIDGAGVHIVQTGPNRIHLLLRTVRSYRTSNLREKLELLYSREPEDERARFIVDAPQSLGIAAYVLEGSAFKRQDGHSGRVLRFEFTDNHEPAEKQGLSVFERVITKVALYKNRGASLESAVGEHDDLDAQAQRWIEDWKVRNGMKKNSRLNDGEFFKLILSNGCFTVLGSYWTGACRGGTIQGKGLHVGRDGWITYVETSAGDGEAEGHGRLVSWGSEYEGGLMMHLPHGEGRQKIHPYATKANIGFSLIGGYAYGDQQGYGVIEVENSIKYEGVFEAGKLNGKTPDELVELLLTKVQKIVYADGVQYEGEMENGKPSGKGEYTYPDEFVTVRYAGGVLNEQFHGEGTLYRRNGDVITGVWKDGRLVDGINKTGTGRKYRVRTQGNGVFVVVENLN